MKITESKLRRIIQHVITESSKYPKVVYYYYDGSHVRLSSDHRRKYFESNLLGIQTALEDARDRGYDEVIEVIMDREKPAVSIDEFIADINEARSMRGSY